MTTSAGVFWWLLAGALTGSAALASETLGSVTGDDHEPRAKVDAPRVDAWEAGILDDAEQAGFATPSDPSGHHHPGSSLPAVAADSRGNGLASCWAPLTPNTHLRSPSAKVALAP